MSFLLLVLWLQMSAPTMPCQSAKLYYDGVLVDEEPHCGLLNQPVNMPTALDDLVLAEIPAKSPWENCVVSDAAGNDRPCGAADETDGKPPTIEWIQTTEPSRKVLSWTSAEKPPKKWKMASCDQPGMTCTTGLTQHPFIPPPVDRVDVPAVQVKSYEKLTIDSTVTCVKGYGFQGSKWQCTGNLRWSCADKSRILEHDENSPPKYWCRKVQQ